MTVEEKRDEAFEAVKVKNYIDSMKLEGMSLDNNHAILPKHVQQYIKDLKSVNGG